MPFLVYLLALAVFAQGTSEFMLSGLLPGIATDLGVSVGAAGLLTSGFALGMVVGAPTMAVLARRLPPRWTLSGFLLLFIAAHAVGACAGDFETLFVTRVLAALANAGFLAVTLSTVARAVPPNSRTRALAIILGGTTVALIAGVPAGAVIGDAFGWRSALWAVAGLCLPALIGILLTVPTAVAGGPHGPAAVPKPDARRPAPALRDELAALRRPELRRYILLAALVNGATFCSFTYLAPIVVDGAGMPRGAVPAVLALFGAGSLVGVLLAGRLGDRSGGPLIRIAVPGLLLGWVVLATTLHSAPAVWALVLPLGALSFCAGSVLVARVVGAAEAAPSLGGSFATAALNVGAVIGPAAGGAALSFAGPAGPALVSAAFVLATVVLGGVRRGRS
ncbi:Cmx/CmrA family chloramphenicol efflux MFS transporter [Leucobacter iarius]|uniref:MFS transporter n=1 Tax=Leucobacter iarius TaxID=333963 RepID=A0ABN2LIA0_9MICO